MRRIKTTEVATVRYELLQKQGATCALCKLPCTTLDAVLDHDHSTGALRGTLHRTCNALLGKVENNYKRYGVKNLGAFCAGLAGYLQRHMVNQTGLLHPTFKTEDEKREKRNKTARLKRAKAKSTAA